MHYLMVYCLFKPSGLGPTFLAQRIIEYKQLYSNTQYKQLHIKFEKNKKYNCKIHYMQLYSNTQCKQFNSNIQ